MPRASFRGLLSDRDPIDRFARKCSRLRRNVGMLSQNRIMQYAPYAANQHRRFQGACIEFLAADQRGRQTVSCKRGEKKHGKKVAEIFIETLVNAGVKRVYGVVGDSLNGLTDVIRKSKKIEWLHVRHEEVAAFAAGAEAHLTGELAVCAGSCGPGNLHLINGLFDCHRNRVPVLAIAAQ